jgi:hypothetical protein
MALNLEDLDDVTRKYMVAEIQADIANGQVYYSKYLTHKGRLEWDRLLLEAARAHDSEWLAEWLREEGLAVPTIVTRDKRGFDKRAPLPTEMLADSEFNRYYIRGLAARAVEEKIPYLISYRAKPVQRPVSSVGAEISPSDLLADLRAHKRRTKFGVPGNPNSGISVRLPDVSPAGKRAQAKH